MGQKARAFDALCEAIRDGKELTEIAHCQESYDRVVREQALNDIDAEYEVIRAALGGDNEAGAAARLILKWCEDVNTRVLRGE